jgi:magnesium-transporting ATPase (P-type)
MLYNRTLVRTSIYARMAPEDKTQLIESLEDLGYVVGKQIMRNFPHY